MKTMLYNGANLAYIGDAYYELIIREHCLKKGITHQYELHKECVKYVSAKAHAKIVNRMLEENFLTEDEVSIYKRGRNHNFHSNRKNLDMKEYCASSGFEALVGYYYLEKNLKRLEEIIVFSIKTIEDEGENNE